MRLDLHSGCQILKVHRSRFKLYNVDELKCPLCLLFVSVSQVHFLLCCPSFSDLRYEFIESKYFDNPYEYRFTLLLATRNERALKCLLCFYIKHSAEGKLCYREEQNVHYDLIFKDIIIIISFASALAPALFICNIPTSVICLLCVYCLIRLWTY